MQELFRIEDVYGDGSVATIEAVDTEGRQVQLEVPSSAADELHPGMVLVLQWWAASVPRVALDENSTGAENTDENVVVETVGPPSGSAMRPGIDETDETGKKSIDQDRVDKEFRALIGLD